MATGVNGDLEDLLVFGYACKVYRDDDRALQAEKALIPWMGDDEITVDRLVFQPCLASSTKETLLFCHDKRCLTTTNRFNDEFQPKNTENDYYPPLMYSPL